MQCTVEVKPQDNPENPDSRFSLIWFWPSSLPSQDSESPTGNLHFPQMKTTGPSSPSSSSPAWPNSFSSTVEEFMLDASNVVFTLFCRCCADFSLNAIFTRFSQTSLFQTLAGGWLTVSFHFRVLPSSSLHLDVFVWTASQMCQWTMLLLYFVIIDFASTNRCFLSFSVKNHTKNYSVVKYFSRTFPLAVTIRLLSWPNLYLWNVKRINVVNEAELIILFLLYNHLSLIFI